MDLNNISTKQIDIIITKRIGNDKEYYNKLFFAFDALETLQIENLISYYSYEMYLPCFKGISYTEASYFQRMNNFDYSNEIYNYLGIKKEKCKIIHLYQKKGN